MGNNVRYFVGVSTGIRIDLLYNIARTELCKRDNIMQN